MVCEGEAFGNPYSGPVLSNQAQKLHNSLNVDNPSNCIVPKGWLPHFQHHHGITQVKINDEARSVDTNVAHRCLPI